MTPVTLKPTILWNVTVCVGKRACQISEKSERSWWTIEQNLGDLSLNCFFTGLL